MDSKFFTLTMALGLLPFAAFAGVKVTSLELKTNGNVGYISIAVEGRSNETPLVKVNGKTIEVTLAQAENFNAINKSVRGAFLSANVLNGKAMIKAVLPYEVAADSVDLGWKNQNIEVIFPRGTAAQTEISESVTRAPAVLPKVISAKAETVSAETKSVEKITKGELNEDYLNKLMHENTLVKTKTPVTDTVKIKKDIVQVKQASIDKAAVTAPKTSTSEFSMAGYAAKFTLFLAVVLGLFYGVVQLIKRGVFKRGKLGFLNNAQLIEVLSTTYVSPKRSLMLIKAHKQIFLVANSESGISFLSEMSDTSGLVKEGEKIVTGNNFDDRLGAAESGDLTFKIKENIMESTPVVDDRSRALLASAREDIVKFSDELKKKAKKLRPIENN